MGNEINPHRYLIILEFCYNLTDPESEKEELVYFFINKKGDITFGGKKPIELTKMHNEGSPVTRDRYKNIVDVFRKRYQSHLKKLCEEYGGAKKEHVEDALWKIQKGWKRSNWSVHSVIGLNNYLDEES